MKDLEWSKSKSGPEPAFKFRGQILSHTSDLGISNLSKHNLYFVFEVAFVLCSILFEAVKFEMQREEIRRE